MRPLWQPDFDFYEARFADDSESQVTRVVLFLDLGAAPHAPLASHPLRLLVRVAMLHARADGLRSEDEAEALFAVEDSIAGRVTSELEAIYVGRVVADGRATFAFYLPQEQAARAEDAGAVIGNVAPYAPEWTVENDVAWAYYRELLYPDEESLADMRSRRAADRILGIGDERS